MTNGLGISMMNGIAVGIYQQTKFPDGLRRTNDKRLVVTLGIDAARYLIFALPDLAELATQSYESRFLLEVTISQLLADLARTWTITFFQPSGEPPMSFVEWLELTLHD